MVGKFMRFMSRGKNKNYASGGVLKSKMKQILYLKSLKDKGIKVKIKKVTTRKKVSSLTT